MATNTKVSPGEIQQALVGATFPADKQMLIKQAKDKGGNSDMVSALNGLPDRQYVSINDVVAELGADMEDDM
jgi:hypothetical protein